MLDSDQLCDLLRFFSIFALSLVNALVSPKLICLKHLSRGYFFCVGGLFGKQGKKLWWFWVLKLLSNSNLRALCLQGGDIPSWKQACRSYHQPQILDDFRYANWREAISMSDSPSHHPEAFFWNGLPSKLVVSQNFEPGLQPKSIQIISDMCC